MKFDIDHIFNLFNTGDVTEINKYVYVNNLKKFTKTIIKNKEFSESLVNSKEDLLVDVDRDTLSKVGEYYLFNKAFEYVKDFNEDWYDSLELSCDLYLGISLKLAISFFEMHEEYEKCAILQKIFNKIQEILDSPQED